MSPTTKESHSKGSKGVEFEAHGQQPGCCAATTCSFSSFSLPVVEEAMQSSLEYDGDAWRHLARVGI